MFNKTTRFVAAAAAALALGIGQAHAEDDAAACQTAQPAAAAFNLKTLHDQLNLGATQEVQWQAAVYAMRQSHSTARMNADQLQVQEQTLLQQPILDLSALHTLHEKVSQEDEALPEQSAKAWLTFYDGLSDQQKTIVSAALKPRFEAIAGHPARPYDPRTGL